MVPGIIGGAIDVVVGLEICQIQGHVGFAKQVHPGVLQSGNGQCVVTCHMIPKIRVAAGGVQTRDIKTFFDSHGHTMEGSPILAPGQGGIGLLRPFQGSIRIKLYYRVEGWVVPLDAAQVVLQQLDCAVVPSLDAGGQLQATAEGGAAHRYLFVRALKDVKSGLLARQAIAPGK